jgi:hypothetical protein
VREQGARKRRRLANKSHGETLLVCGLRKKRSGWSVFSVENPRVSVSCQISQSCRNVTGKE